MNLFKKLLSYLYPIKVTSIPSERSGILEVTLVNGKLVIDSKSANYSYGSLQKVLKKGLLHIGIDTLQNINSILVLGVAGGSVIQTLRNDFNLTANVTGVEIDKEVLTLANNYFKLNQTTGLKLINTDAFQFIYTNKTYFDLIIIDIFNDKKMPVELFEIKFWNEIFNSLNSNGFCVFNTIYTSKKDIQRNQQLALNLKKSFTSVKQIKTQQINELFILQK